MSTLWAFDLNIDFYPTKMGLYVMFQINLERAGSSLALSGKENSLLAMRHIVLRLES